MLAGLVLDSLLVASGWVAYPNGIVDGRIGALLDHRHVGPVCYHPECFHEMDAGPSGLAVLMGAFGGPLSYLAGAETGCHSFNDPVLALVALAIAWGAGHAPAGVPGGSFRHDPERARSTIFMLTGGYPTVFDLSASLIALACAVLVCRIGLGVQPAARKCQLLWTVCGH